MSKSRRNFLIVLAMITAASLMLLLRRATEAPHPNQTAVSTPQTFQAEPAASAAFPGHPLAARPGASASPFGGNIASNRPTPVPAPAFPVSTPLDASEKSSVPDFTPAPGLEPHIAAQAVRSAIQKYGAAYGGNPVGTNAEITRALNGDNPTHAKFLDEIPGQQINSNGELVDTWGTPYFFHQLSGNEMEVRSAGPDRIMWNTDDIILR